MRFFGFKCRACGTRFETVNGHYVNGELSIKCPRCREIERIPPDIKASGGETA